MLILVTSPEGEDLEVEVPEGVTAGDDFEISFGAGAVSPPRSPARSPPRSPRAQVSPPHAHARSPEVEEAQPPPQAAAAAALLKQQPKTTLEFLEACRLDKYVDQITELGAESVDDLPDIAEPDLDEIGFKKMEKKRFFSAVAALALGSEAPAEAEPPGSKRERRKSIQDDLEAEFSGGDVNAASNSPGGGEEDPYASLSNTYGEEEVGQGQGGDPSSPTKMLAAMDLGGKAISEGDLVAQEEALAATRTEIDKEETRALSARERQELGFEAAQQQLDRMQAKVSARQNKDADEATAIATVLQDPHGRLSLGLELPSYLESGLAASQIKGDHIADARVVAFEEGSLGMGLAVHDSFEEGSDSLLGKYSTLVERLNPTADGSAGAAEATGAVFVGDVVVVVNGLDVSDKDHGQVIAHVRASTRPVEIGFLSPHQLDPSLSTPRRGSPEEDGHGGPGFIQLVAEELAWDLLAPLSAKETIDRACAELGIDTANNSTHEAAGLVAQQLGIPGLVDNRSLNTTLSSVHESPEEEAESPSPRSSPDGHWGTVQDHVDALSPDPRAKAKARALTRARARQEASRPLTDNEAAAVLVEEQKRRTDWLRQVPLFRPIKSKKAFMEDLARKLEVRTLRKGTLIIEKGDETATEMYFIARGIAEVLNDLDEKAFGLLEEGAFCGEGALLENDPRNAFVRIKTDTVKLYALNRTNLQAVFDEYPDVEKIIRYPLEERRLAREEAKLAKEAEKDGLKKLQAPKYYESHVSTGKQSEDDFIQRQLTHLTEKERKLVVKREAKNAEREQHQAMLMTPPPKALKKRPVGPLSPRNKVSLSGAAVNSFVQRMEQLEKEKQEKLERRRVLEEQRLQRKLQSMPKISRKSRMLAESTPREARESRRLNEKARTIRSKVNGAHLAQQMASERSTTKVDSDIFMSRVEEDLYRRSEHRAQLQRRAEEEESNVCTFEPDLNISFPKQRFNPRVSRLKSELRELRREPRPPMGMMEDKQMLINHTTKWIARHGPEFEGVVRKQKHGVAGWEFMEIHTRSNWRDPVAKEKQYYNELLAFHRGTLKTEAVEIVGEVADSQFVDESRQAEREAVEHVVMAAELAAADAARRAAIAVQKNMELDMLSLDDMMTDYDGKVDGSFAVIEKEAAERADTMMSDLKAAKEQIAATSPYNLASKVPVGASVAFGGITPIRTAAPTENAPTNGIIHLSLEPDPTPTPDEDPPLATPILETPVEEVEEEEQGLMMLQRTQTPETADAFAMLQGLSIMSPKSSPKGGLTPEQKDRIAQNKAKAKAKRTAGNTVEFAPLPELTPLPDLSPGSRTASGSRVPEPEPEVEAHLSRTASPSDELHEMAGELMAVLGTDGPKLLLEAARNSDADPSGLTAEGLQVLQREADNLISPWSTDGPDEPEHEYEHKQLEVAVATQTTSVQEAAPPRSPLKTHSAMLRDAVDDAANHLKMMPRGAGGQAKPDMMSASALQTEYDDKQARFEQLAADIDAQLADDDALAADVSLRSVELQSQLESAKSNAKSQIEARAAAERAAADAALEVRRLKRQFGSELKTTSSRVAQSDAAMEKVRLAWQETAIRRRKMQLLSEMFMAWVYTNYETQVQVAASEQALENVAAKIAAAEEHGLAELERERAEHAVKLSQIEQSVRVETAEELQKAEFESERMRSLYVESAIRRMKNAALSRAFVAWADAAWAKEMESLESLETLAREEGEARVAAETRANEEGEARAAAEEATAKAQAQAAEAEASHQAALEVQQVTQAKLVEQAEALAEEQARAAQLQESQAAAEEQAKAATAEAVKQYENVNNVKVVFQDAAIRRMRHGLVSRVFTAWSDAVVDAMFEVQMKDLQEMADDEAEARREAQDAARQAKGEAEEAQAKVAMLTEAAGDTVVLMEAAAEAEAKAKQEAEARAGAEAAMAKAQAEAAEAEKQIAGVLEAEQAMQAKLVAQAEALYEEQEKARELAESRAAIEEQAAAAAAEVVKATGTVDTVQGRWQDAAVRRMRHGLVSRVFTAWSDAIVDAMFEIQIDDLQKLADEESEKRKAAQDATRAAKAEAEAYARRASEAERKLEEAEELTMLEGADEDLESPDGGRLESPVPAPATASTPAPAQQTPPASPSRGVAGAREHIVWNKEQQEVRLLINPRGVKILFEDGTQLDMPYTQIKSWSAMGEQVVFVLRDGDTELRTQGSAEAAVICEEVAEASRQAARPAAATATAGSPTRTPPRGGAMDRALAARAGGNTTPANMPATPQTPASAGKDGSAYFKVLQRSIVRGGVEMNSPKKTEMEVGQVITVEETALNSAGTLRVRFDKGWTSMASGSGVKILER